MMWRLLASLVCLVLVLCEDMPPGISSSFLGSAEGWGARGGGVRHSPGMIVASDGANEALVFEAPAVFLGDQSAFEGGELRYRLGFFGTEGGWEAGSYDVELESSQHKTVLWISGLVPRRSFLANVEARLCAGCGWEVAGTGGAPTERDFRRVLSTLTALRIRGGYHEGGEESFLMSVALSPPATAPSKPPPGTPATASGGGGGSWVMQGTSGTLELTATHMYFTGAGGEGRSEVHLRDIESVDVVEGSVEVAARGGARIACGLLRGYGDVSEVARMMEEARRRADALRQAGGGEEAAKGRGGQGEGMGGAGASGQARDAPEGTPEAAKAKESKKKGKKDKQPPAPKAAVPPREKADPATVGVIKRGEESLGYDAAMLLRRVVGGDGSVVILSPDAIAHVWAPKGAKEASTRELPLAGLGIQRRRGSVVMTGGGVGGEIALDMGEFEFQELMGLIDEASRIMGLV